MAGQYSQAYAGKSSVAQSVDLRCAAVGFHLDATPVSGWPVRVRLPSSPPPNKPPSGRRKAGWARSRRSPSPPVGFVVGLEQLTASSRAVHVRPFALPSVQLLRPLPLTPDQSRRRLLAVARYGLRLAYCLFARLRPAACRNARIILSSSETSLLLRTSAIACRIRSPQVRTLMSLCTSAAFTLSVASDGLRHGGANSPADQAFYAVSVRCLARLHSGFLQTSPRGLALASTSGYHRPASNPCRYSHRDFHHLLSRPCWACTPGGAGTLRDEDAQRP